MDFVRGMRAKLAGLPAGQPVTVGVAVRSAGGAEVDVCCFGLDAQGRLSDDSYFIFYNQAESPCGAMALAPAPAGERQCFRVELGRLPPHVRHLVITASIDGDGSMSELQPGYLRVSATAGDVARFAFRGSDFALEKSIILAELYERDGTWRFWAVGQGFAGGLEALLAHYGGSTTEGPPPPTIPDIPAPKPREATQPPDVAPPLPTPPPAPTPKAPPPTPKAPPDALPPPPPVPTVLVAPAPVAAAPAAAKPPAPIPQPVAASPLGSAPGFFCIARPHRVGSVRVLVDGERIPTSAVVAVAEQSRTAGMLYAIDHERVCARAVVRVDFDEAEA